MQSPSTTNLSLKLLTTVMLISILCSCHKGDPFPQPQEENADVVYDWYKFIAKTQRPASPQPVVILANRNFGFIGVGLYEAVRPGSKGSASLSSLLYQMPSMPEADLSKKYLWIESANAALASMFKLFLVNLTDANKASIDSMEKANYNRFRLNTSDAVLMRSQAFGRALLAYSLTAIAPAPISFSEEKSSQFYKANNEVYEIGKNLTAARKATADWWADAGGASVGVPAPYHLLSIITWVQEDRKAKLWRAAEVYAKTGIALKDGPIITFRSKFHYNLIRPITYIQRNIDAAWLPYLATPPYPEYTSGLVGIYGPVIQVLKNEYGDIDVTDNAYDWRGIPARHFTSLSNLLDEAAISRVYGGLHYKFTQEVSIKVGKQLADEISDLRLLSPRYTHP